MVRVLVYSVIAAAGLVITAPTVGQTQESAFATHPPTTAPSTQRVAPTWTASPDAPWWVREGLLIASVEEVPVDRAWRVTGGRTRKPTFDELEGDTRERSEETIRVLKQIGVTLVLVPYGGFGPDALEADQRHIARETIERCKRFGLRCGVWLPVGQIDPDVWAAEDAMASDRLMRNRDGKPLAAAFRGRKLESTAAAGVLDRYRRLAREAVAAGAAALFLPEWRATINFEPAAAPAFRSYLERTLSAGDPRRATLLEQLASGGLPEDASSPLAPYWAACRVDALGEALKAIASEARAARDDVLIGVDPVTVARQIGAPGGTAFDPSIVLLHADVALTQQAPTLTGEGEIRHQIIDLKLATAVGCRVAPRVLRARGLTQALAFGGDAGGVAAYFTHGNFTADLAGRISFEPKAVEMAQRYRQRRELYAGLRPEPDVLVWWPPAARLGFDGTAQVGFVQAASALVTHRVPFSFATDERPADPPADRAVLVAGVPTVTSAQAEWLGRHVARGGGLLLVGSTTVRDSVGGDDAPELAAFLARETAGATATTRGAAESRPVEGEGFELLRVGRGRVVRMERPGPPFNFWLTTRDARKVRHAPPLESDWFAEAVRAALGRPLSVESAIDRGVAIEWTHSDDGRRVLHVVNFNRGGEQVRGTFRLHLPNGAKIRRIHQYDATGAVPEAREWHDEDGVASFAAEGLGLYTAFLIE